MDKIVGIYIIICTLLTCFATNSLGYNENHY